MPDFIIHKRNGSFTNIGKMQEYNKNLPDGSYLVSIESTKKRSLDQNAWFHAVLPDILQGLREIGYNEVKDVHDAKEVVKGLFFKKKYSNGSEVIETVESTSGQSKINFAEKADEIIMWASTYLGIDIAPPEKQLDLYE